MDLESAEVPDNVEAFAEAEYQAYLFGRAQADHSLSLEQLVASPEVELRRLFAAAASLSKRALRPKSGGRG